MTSNPVSRRSLHDLHRALTSGRIDRRQFSAHAASLGASAAAIATILANSAAGAQGATPEPVASPGASPVATPMASPVPLGSLRPDAGTEGQTRGAGGDLRILVPQAASALSVHNATGGKDIAAGSIVSEPLLHYAADTSLVANLVVEVPSQENGLLAADLSTVTFNLLPGVLWSEGEPFTADDVVFTWEWNVDPANQSIDSVSWEIISGIEARDDLTVVVTFADPTLGWFQPFGSNLGAIYPRHFWEGRPAADANAAFASAPIGTGAYVVETFSPNDQVIYAANPNYREPNKPFFQRVILKGGGDPASAVRAVTVTGEWDLAFTLQIDPDALRATLGDRGAVYGPPGTGVEKIQFNFSDPNTEVTTVIPSATPQAAGTELTERSHKDTPHPFLTEREVRQAIAVAIDRQTIADRLFGGAPTDPPGRNILTGLAQYESPNTSWEYDPDKARAILDEAGWVLNGTVREKNGVPLELRYVTTTTLQRQKVQAVVKSNLEEIGFAVQLASIDGSIFFDGDSENEQNFTHFYSDMQQYTDGATSAFPLNYMKYWYAGPDDVNIAQRSNEWTGTNKTRYRSADYDAAYERIAAVTVPEDATALFIQLNDMVINEVVEIPLVQVVADRYVTSNAIRADNIAVSAFGDMFWNIANWNRLA